MSKFDLGSICLDDLFAASKAGHSSIATAKNGKKYANICIWHNPEPDKFGNDGSIQLNSTKEKRESESKIYIGNIKNPGTGNQTQASQSGNDDIPF